MDNDTPVENTSPTSSDSSRGSSKKIIQPLDPNLKIENQALPEATIPVMQQNEGIASSNPVASQETVSPSNSIYPTATKGINAESTSQAEDDRNQRSFEDSNETPLSNLKRKVITILVIILGVIIVLPALFSLIGAGTLLSVGFVTDGSMVVIIMELIYLCIGVGLILRKEAARFAYIILAVFFLILSLYGTYRVYSKERESTIPKGGTLHMRISADLSYCFGLPTTPQRQQVIKELEKDINTNQQPSKICSNPEASASKYIALIPGYLLDIIPLVFLNLRSVKQIFN